MKELVKIDNKKVSFRLQLNYNNLYARLQMLLGKKADLFADLKIKASETIWYAPDEDDYICYSDASEGEKVAIIAYLNERKIEIEEALSQSSELKLFISDLLSIPDERFIYYRYGKGEIVVVLAAWGYRMTRVVEAPDVISALIGEVASKHQDVRVVCLLPDGQLAVNQVFFFTYKGIIHEKTTDEQGCFKAGLLLIGSQFLVVDPLTHEEFSITVNAGQSVYEIEFSMLVSATISIVNQSELPISDIPLSLKNGEQQFQLTTDTQGSVSVDGLLYNSTHHQVDIEVVGFQWLHYPLRMKDNHYKIKISQPESQEVVVKVIDQNKAICSHHELILFSNQEEERVMTDEKGQVSLSLIRVEDVFEVTDAAQLTNKKKYTVIRNKKEYEFSIVRENEKKQERPEEAKTRKRACSLYVVNAFQKGVSGYSLTFRRGDVDTILRSLEDGLVILPEMFVGERFGIIDNSNWSHSVEYEVHEQVDKNTFYFQLLAKEKKDICVSLFDEEKIPISNGTLTLKARKGNFIKTTDQQGMIYAPYDMFTHKEKIGVDIYVPGRRIKSTSLRFNKDCLSYSVGLKKAFSWKWLWGTLAFLTFVLLAGLAYQFLRHPSLEEMERGVVLVRNVYYHSVDLDGEEFAYFSTLDEKGKFFLVFDRSEVSYVSSTGTGFFVSKGGVIATNRHVVEGGVDESYVKDALKKKLLDEKAIFTDSLNTVNANLRILTSLLLSTSEDAPNYSKMQKEYQYFMQAQKELQDNINSADRLITAENWKLTCHLSVSIAYNNTFINNEKDFLPCSIVDISDKEEVDLAIIRLNDKKTPKDAYVFNVPKKDPLRKVKETDRYPVTLIGFNLGTNIGKTKDGLKAQVTSGTISQTDKYRILYTIPTLHGSSGSPVLNDNGMLVAINYAGFDSTQGFNYGVKASFLWEMMVNLGLQ